MGVLAGTQRLAGLYFGGRGVTQDYGKAARLCHKSAPEDYMGCQYILGYVYHFGKGVQQDDGQAVYWYRMAARSGFSAANRNLCGLNLKWGKWAEALKWCQSSVDAGEESSHFGLAQIYAYGWGVAADYKKAVYHARAGIDGGMAGAYTILGQLYLNGHGVSKDAAKAAELYHKGAIAGDSTAQGNYGVVLFFGIGVAKNQEESRRWLDKAAGNGNEKARVFLQKQFRN